MDIDSLRRAMAETAARLHNWRLVGREYGISGGMAWRIVRDGYDPRETEIRRRLGLPVYAPAPVCQDCGEVHVVGECTRGKRVRVVKPTERPVCADCKRVYERDGHAPGCLWYAVKD